jgi:hypothetical protein
MRGLALIFLLCVAPLFADAAVQGPYPPAVPYTYGLMVMTAFDIKLFASFTTQANCNAALAQIATGGWATSGYYAACVPL